MGNLVVWMKGSGGSTIHLDFESADVEVTEKERDLHERLRATLERSQKILADIEDYKGCQDLARKAMSNATKENEEAAFLGLLQAVNAIKSFYDFAEELGRVLPDVVRALAEPEEGRPNSNSLRTKQALARSLASLLDFILLFDQIRMMRPHLSNDFSYYRRLLPKFSKHPRVEVKEDEANAMALFTAQHIPMMSKASDSIKAMNKDGLHQEYFTLFATMANTCYELLATKKFGTAKTNLFCARAMTGALVIYDRVDGMGAFWKKSPVKARKIIEILKTQFPGQEALLNAIRFSTLHFKDDTTPSSIHSLFG